MFKDRHRASFLPRGGGYFATRGLVFIIDDKIRRLFSLVVVDKFYSFGRRCLCMCVCVCVCV